MAFPPDVRNTYLHMPNSAMACVANCSLRETGLHIIIEFNTIITKEAIASKTSWTRTKEDAIIEAEGAGSASETKEDGSLGCPRGANSDE